MLPRGLGGCGHQVGVRLHEHRFEKRCLGGEVVIQRTGRYPRLAGRSSTDVARNPFSPNSRRPAATSAARVWATCSARRDAGGSGGAESDISLLLSCGKNQPSLLT